MCACVPHHGTALRERLAAIFTLVRTLDGVYGMMHAQALPLLEGLTAMSALIVSCIGVDLAIRNTIALLNNNNKRDR